MEGRVEDRHVRHVREHAPGFADRLQRGHVVQRRELREPFERAQHVVVDQHRLTETGAAVHDAMGDRGHVVRGVRERGDG